MRAALGLTLLLGCSFDWEVYDPRLGSGGAGGATATVSASATSSSSATSSNASVGSGGAGGTGGGPTLDCPNAPGPPMIDLGTFCIDATEVTQAHYDEFLEAQVPPQTQSNDPPVCSWNPSYTVTASPLDYPVIEVDWCDAQAYCQWAGKRLCGRIGGGANPLADAYDATLSEWHHACTNAGASAYPYGDTPDGLACNTSESTLGIQPVGMFTACTGTTPPFDGVYDLSGNVHEWTNDCDGNAGAGDNCLLRGGSAVHGSDASGCADPYTATRSEYFSDTGIRCCADSPP